MSLEGETEYTLSGWFSVSEFLTWDEDSKLEILWLNGSASPVTHYYVLNLQGDVVGLIDEDSALVAKYTYSAWGEIISVTDAAGAAITSSTHIANINPLRYRGYYYDSETGFYYLQSRYYDPITHRFINADSYQSTGQGFTGTNMFAYCNNNPVVYADSNGNLPFVNTMVTDGGGRNQYNSIEEAAVAAGTTSRNITDTNDRENICGIYCLPNGNFVTGYYYAGKHDSADAIVVFDEANRHPSWELVFLLHSHPYCTGHIPNNFSIIDETGEFTGDAALVLGCNIPLFLAAPNGTLQLLFVDDNSLQIALISEDLPVDTTRVNCIGRQIK